MEGDPHIHSTIFFEVFNIPLRLTSVPCGDRANYRGIEHIRRRYDQVNISTISEGEKEDKR